MKISFCCTLAILLISFLFIVNLSYGDACCHIVPLLIHSEKGDLKVYGQIYLARIIGKDNGGNKLEVYLDSKKFLTIAKTDSKNLSIKNQSENITIFNVDYFCSANGMFTFSKYTLDKNGYAIWVNPDDIKYITLDDFTSISRNGKSFYSTIVTGTPEDLMIGKGLYHISWDDPIGCPMEFQSDNPVIAEQDLKDLQKILINIEPGLSNYFPLLRMYDYKNKIKSREEYIYFAEENLNEFDNSIKALEMQPVPLPFDELKKEIVRIYKERLRFGKILLGWLQHNDFNEFRNEIINFYSDSKILEILDLIEKEKEWNKAYKLMNFKLYNHVNRNKFSFDDIRKLQDELLKENNLRIVSDPRCQG